MRGGSFVEAKIAKYIAAVFVLIASQAHAGDQDVFLKTATGTLWGSYESGTSAAMLILPGSGPTDRNGNGPSLHPGSYKLLADALASRDIATLRIDKRGVGESAPALASESDIRFQTYVDDARAWAADLKTRSGQTCVWIVGHSEGALIAELAAKDNADICGLVLVAGAGRKAGDIMRAQFDAAPGVPADLKAKVFAAIAEFEAGHTVDPPPLPMFRASVQPYLISWMSLDPAKILAETRAPVLILQGDNDIQVSVEDAKLLAAARPDAKLVILPGVNHILKTAPADRAGNIATYGDPTLPLAPGVVDAIADFVSKTRT